MAANEIHVGDIGTVFELTIQDDTSVIDISAATLADCIKFEKPAGTTVSKLGVLVTDGTDGKVKYTTILNDLDEAGDWSVQAKVMIGGAEWHSDIGNFEVHGNL